MLFMGGGKHEKQMKMGDRELRRDWVPCRYADEEFDSKYICSRKCFRRTVLLIKISKGSAIPQVLRKYNAYSHHVKSLRS